MSYDAREGEIPPVNGPPRVLPPYQGVPQLFIEEGTNNHLLYRIGDTWWDALTLTPNQVPLGTMRLQHLMDIDLEEYQSQPVYVALQNNDWAVLSSSGNRLFVHPEAVEFLAPYPNDEDPVEFVTPFLIPGAQLPPFNPVWMERLSDLVDNVLPLSELDLSSIPPQPTTPPRSPSALLVPSAPRRPRRAQPRLSESTSPGDIHELSRFSLTQSTASTGSGGLRFGEMEREAAGLSRLRTREMIDARTGLGSHQPLRQQVMSSSARRLDFPETTPEEPSLHRQSVETLMRQLYGLPVTLPQELTVNQLQTPFVTFDRAVELIQSGRVQRFTLDPLLQPWAGPPTSPNRIVTLILNDGTTVLVRAHYNPINNNIMPPV